MRRAGVGGRWAGLSGRGAGLRPPPRDCGGSEDEPQAIPSDLDSRGLDLSSLPRVLEEHRVRIIDMQVDFSPCGEPGDRLQAASRPTDRQVPHLRGGRVSCPRLGQLALRPERAVDQHRIAAVQPPQDQLVEHRDPGQDGQAAPRLLVFDEVAGAIAGSGSAEPSRYLGGLPGREGLEEEAAGTPVGERQGRQPIRRLEPLQSAVPGEASSRRRPSQTERRTAVVATIRRRLASRRTNRPST